MKPEVLTICAFGPYQKKVCLDFSVLSEQPFFLIHGATGAGKTSIFDAICYALYGEAATEARTPRMLRNREAGPEDDTYVDLTFCVRDTHWHIRRNPEYMRKAKRGKGLARQAPEVLLERLEDGRAAESWTRDGEVQACIVRLLGFQCKQFRQVVLLPQGEFRRFLMADTSARKAIMKVLFNTEIYQKLEDKLKAKAAEIGKSYDSIAEKQRLYLDEAGAGDEAEFCARLEMREKEAETLTKKTAALQQVKEAREKKRDAAREVMAKFRQAEAAVAEVQKWEKTIPEDDVARSRLDKADRAASLIDFARQLREAQLDAKRRQQELERLQQQGRKLAAAHEEAKASFQEVQAGKTAHAAEKEALVVLRGLLTVARELELAQKDAAVKQETSERLQKEAAAAKQKLAEGDKLLQEEKKQAEALRTKALALDSLQLQQQNLLAEQKKWDDAADSAHALQEARAVYDQAEKASKSAEAIWQTARAELNQLRELAKEGRAVLLAEHLQEGEPCPVCGSEHHPKLARAVTEVITDARLQEKETSIQSLEKSYQSAAFAAQSKAGLLAAAEAKDKECRKQLGVKSRQELAEGLQEIQKALQAARLAEQGYAKQMEKLADLQDRQDALQAKADRGEAAAARSTSEAAAARALADDKKAQLAGRELPAEPKALQRQWQQREAAWKAEEEKAAAAETNYHDLHTRYHAAQSAWLTKREELRRSVAQAETLQKGFVERLAQAGFADEMAYEEALQGSWADKNYREQVRQELLAHEQALHTAETNLMHWQTATRDLQKPDLESLEREASEAQMAWQGALRESSSAETVLKSWQKRALALQELRKKSGALTDAYARITSLSELASGKTGSKVSFQTYVLHSLLDDVMEMANQRLLIMSRGQYELHAGQRQRANQQGGLDMEIFDHYSGYARPLATLSGGESFLASLSLALGLADVVQACAGGVRLDTMFIDEGFGTLDSETLDVALKALFELQKSGRLIGIISHVEELRSRIPARLEVTKTKSGGSTAHFELGTAES
ncbi:AAA family ATPase [uncultured Mitsuokella sp.]|uniref:AAA family ATPase n=1 Tax=uncultured Mitsuokella sp. TaxID=453120 RepID=UPI00259360F4|nr:AAA family ATPase [uncultured Mitsuokella sp.]